MGKRSFALGVLTALAAAAATEDSHTHTYARANYTTRPVTTTSTPVVHHVVYTDAPTLTVRARTAFEKMMVVNKAFTLSSSDCIYEVGKEIRRIYLEDETNRTSLSFDERKAVRKLVDAYDLPIGNLTALAVRFGRLCHSDLV